MRRSILSLFEMPHLSILYGCLQIKIFFCLIPPIETLGFLKYFSSKYIVNFMIPCMYSYSNQCDEGLTLKSKDVAEFIMR